MFHSLMAADGSIKTPLKIPGVGIMKGHVFILVTTVLTPIDFCQCVWSLVSSGSPGQMENHRLIHLWRFTTFLVFITLRDSRSITYKAFKGLSSTDLSIKCLYYLFMSGLQPGPQMHSAKTEEFSILLIAEGTIWIINHKSLDFLVWTPKLSLY